MYDRAQLEEIPAVFRDVLDDEALDTANFAETMSALLAQIHGLAGVCYGSTKDENTAWQDLSQALDVLHAYTESAVEFFDRWHKAAKLRGAVGGCAHRGTQAPD